MQPRAINAAEAAEIYKYNNHPHKMLIKTHPKTKCPTSAPAALVPPLSSIFQFFVSNAEFRADSTDIDDNIPVYLMNGRICY